MSGPEAPPPQAIFFRDVLLPGRTRQTSGAPLGYAERTVGCNPPYTLEFQRQIAQVQVAFLVVPGNNLGTGTVFSVFTDPRSNLVVGRSGGDKGPEIVIINLCKFQPALIERAIGVVFAFPTHKHRAAFVYSTRRQHIASQRLARASRELFPIAQIAGE